MPEELVNVVSPSGELGSMPKSTAREALATGFKLASNEEVIRHKLEEKYGGEAGTAFAVGAARGLTLTGSDYVLGALGQKDRLQAYDKLYSEQMLGGEVVGGIAGLALSGGSSAIARGLSAPTRLLTAAGQKAGSMATSGLMRGAIAGATEGAIFGGLSDLSGQYVADIPINGERLFSAAASGALYGGAFGGAIGGASSKLSNLTASEFRVAQKAASGDAASGLIDDFVSWRANAMARKGQIPEHQVKFIKDLSAKGAWERAVNGKQLAEEVSSKWGKELNHGVIEAEEAARDAINAINKNQANLIPNASSDDVVKKLMPSVEELEGLVAAKADELVMRQTPNFYSGDKGSLMKKVRSRIKAFRGEVVEDTFAEVAGQKVLAGSIMKVSPQAAHKKALALVNDIDDLVQSIERKNPSIAGQISDITSEFRYGAKGSLLFGAASSSVKEANDVISNFAKARKTLDKHLTRDGKFDKKFNAWATSESGLAKWNSSEAGKAFKDYQKATRELHDFVESASDIPGMSKANVKKVERLRRGLDGAAEELDSVAIDLEDFFKMEALQKSNARSLNENAMIAGTAGHMASTAGIGAGIATGNPLFAPLGFAVGSAGQAAYRYGNNPILLAHGAGKLRGLLAKSAKQTVKTVEELGDTAIKTSTKLRKPTTAKGSGLLTVPIVKEAESSYEEVVDSFFAKHGQDTAIREELMRATGDNPMLNGSIEEAVATSARARDYIMGLAWSRSVGIKPSRLEMSRVMGAIQGIKYPDKILERTLSGKITSAEAKAFKSVYPNEFSELKKLVENKITDIRGEGKDLPWSTKVRLHYVFGIKTDRKMSLRYLTEISGANMKEQMLQNPQSAKRNTAVPELSKAFEDTSDTIAGRT